MVGAIKRETIIVSMSDRERISDQAIDRKHDGDAVHDSNA